MSVYRSQAGTPESWRLTFKLIGLLSEGAKLRVRVAELHGKETF